MNALRLKNSALCSVSDSARNTNSAYFFGVRFFAYSVFYYFYYFFKAVFMQRCKRSLV